MSVEECNKKMMKDFELKLMPDMLANNPSWKPVQHENIEASKGEW